MDAVAVTANLVLAALTAFYVYFTYKLLRQAIRANQLSQQAFERQFQLATYPRINCRAHLKGGRAVLTVENLGSFLSRDVDVLILGLYPEDDMPASQFVAEYVREDSGFQRRLFGGEEGFYGVYDHLLYPVAAERTRVVATLQFPMPPKQLTLLLQFRDITGTNYYNVYWFFLEGETTDEGRFRLGGLSPSTIAQAPRVSFDEHLNLRGEAGSPLREDVVNDFEPVWRCSIPCGHLRGDYAGVEDRGEWQPL
jgi:hypothetical protein